jgi:serine/threonine protein kinase/formylglycine-generating enzyme required for sulfatase activity
VAENDSRDDEDTEAEKPGGLAARLRRLIGEDVDPGVTLDAIESDPPSAASDLSDRVLKRLRAHGVKETRYVLKGEVARGGMGVILKAWDEDLRRNLAMKVVIDRSSGEDVAANEIDPKTLCRFLEEAQITGQLDHPGIVPVHELGLDAAGHVYFTMRLVKGRTLKHVFDLVHKGESDWTVTRTLGVLMKVCEAMAYAHAKGVIHRDIKPANIMVGRFGEVYVMDWGLARVIGAEDRHDIRINRELMSAQLSTVRSERRPDGEVSDDALVTMDGDIVGTPAYLSPEQGRGEIAKLDARTDVYSVGCMLYQLLAGQVPFMPSGARIGPHMLLMRVLEGPPKPLAELAPEAPAELIAICDKAMAREPADRYWTADDLASDLRAYLDGRVVRAYESGALAEIKKWVARNRLAAAASFLAMAAVVGGLIAKGEVAAQNRRALDESADSYRARELLEDAIEPLPSHPDKEDQFREWLQRARALVEKRGRHEERLAELEAAVPAVPSVEQLLQLERERELIENLERLEGPGGEGVIRQMQARLQVALDVDRLTLSGPGVAARWTEAIAAIEASPHYSGLRLEPQLGLVPVRENPVTEFWEFWHLETGIEPESDDSGGYRVTKETGLVFVLIPAGTYHMGTQARRPDEPNYDLLSMPNERPMRQRTVKAFFLSKYEMTQGQWLGLTGENPSQYPPGGDVESDWTHPVEWLSWATTQAAMTRLGLELPTEEQWEFACRAGTESPWSSGPDMASLARVANVADKSTRASQFTNATKIAPWDDGFAAHAPVGSFEPNPWGLYDTHGNVHEWVVDLHTHAYEVDPSGPWGERGIRGGSWKHSPDIARSAMRYGVRINFLSPTQGVRPARSVER